MRTDSRIFREKHILLGNGILFPKLGFRFRIESDRKWADLEAEKACDRTELVVKATSMSCHR